MAPAGVKEKETGKQKKPRQEIKISAVSQNKHKQLNV